MSKKKFSCDSCDGYGIISHSMDSEFYQVNACPFCGAELQNTRDTEEDDE